MTRRVLLVDDDAAVRDALAETLELADLAPIQAGSFVVAKDHISADFDGVILSDIRMPGRDGFHLLDHARQVDADLPVVLLTGEGDIPMAVDAMGRGAFDFLEKPCAPERLLAVLGRALHTRALVLENRKLRKLAVAGDAADRMLFGTSPQADGLRGTVRRVAELEADVLVYGPPGSGVPKVAEVLHLSSRRAKGPLVKRAAAELTAQALRGAVEAAKGGSLFLDEVAGLPPATQLALAEPLDDVRLLAGSTRDLAAQAEAGAFNADLYWRIAAMPVRIPALSERPEDIPVLFRHYVAQAAEQAALEAPEITPAHLAQLMAQDWPGNARGLMSAAMRYALRVEDAPDAELGLAEQLAQVERALLSAALQRAGGQASVAAKALKLPRKTFYDKLARHGIRAEAFRG
ncbi:MAG: sigma-54 dependent transcriptional regulator [Pseudomonadota bacterium]